MAVKTLKGDKISVIAIEPENCGSFKAAMEAGKPVDAFKAPTLADGLAVPVVGEISFNVARNFVDKCVEANLQATIASVPSIVRRHCDDGCSVPQAANHLERSMAADYRHVQIGQHDVERVVFEHRGLDCKDRRVPVDRGLDNGPRVLQ